MKKTIAVIMTIITLTAALCACTSKGDDTSTTSTTTAQTTTEVMPTETTTEEITTTEPTTKVKPTAPSVPEWCEEIEVKASEIPMELDGVTFKKAVFYKATEERRNELSTYGDDPNVDNELFIFVEGNSADLEIFYNTSSAGNIKSSSFYEDSRVVWSGDYDYDGPYELQMVEKEEGITVSGFSSDVLQITQRFQMFRECLKLDEAFVKRVTIILA